MSQRNKNNSIIFLTTLSVYLGLVLVGGATSSVLAQAATTRNFDIQDEIEVKDGLDKKPDDEEIEGVSKKAFPALFIQLLDEIKGEIKNGKISSPIQTNFVIESLFRLPGTYIGTSRWSSISDRNLSGFLGEAIDRKFVSKINKIADYHDEESNYGKVQLEADENNLLLKISFTKLNAEQFAEFLNQEFSLPAISAENELTKQIYENTKATSENNQVFIVTRLPRGSLDELLKNAKAESK